MIVLDTNVLSEMMKAEPNPQVQIWLGQRGEEPLATTSVSVSEITYGLEKLPQGRRRADLIAAFDRLVDAVTVLPLETAAAIRAGQFRAIREAAGHPSTASDMLIAGIAACADAMLATRNIKDFTGLPLRVVDPWQAN